jgi:5-methylcytosine-specific restriction endonuclease McrA
MRVCSKCGAEKALEDFAKDNRSPAGRSARCKACVNAEARERYPRYREKKAAYGVKNRKRFRARDNERVRRWRANNLDRARAKGREAARRFRERNPDYYRERYEQNIENERARSREIMRENRAKNPEMEKARKKRYRERNREAVANREREKTYARRAKQKGSPELALLMGELVKQPCVYCGSTERITIDHVVPLSRGGKHEAENLAPACLPCNASKSNRLPSEWKGRF